MADITIYLTVNDNVLRDSLGGELFRTDDWPFAHFLQKPTIRIYFRAEDGLTAWDGLTAGDGILVVVDKDFNHDTAPMARTLTGFTIEPTLGYIEFILNANTTQWETAVGTSSGIDSSGMEVQIIPNGETDIASIFQFGFLAKNVRDDQVQDPDPLPDNYPSYAEIQASFMAKALFDANTILAADADDTPTPRTIAEGQRMGRPVGSTIKSLTTAEDGAITALTAAAATAVTDPTAAGVFTAFIGGVIKKITWANMLATITGMFKVLNGFENRTDSVLAMSGADLQISPTATSWSFWNAGTKTTKSAMESVTISNDLTLHYVYYNVSAVLTVSTTLWDFTSDFALVAMVYKSGANYAIFDERHGHRRDRNWHQWAHDTIGARYESGLAGTFANATFSIAQGIIHDEDIKLDTGGALTTCRLWYRSVGAASMTFESAIATLYKQAAGVIQWDDGGTLTNAGSNKYVNSFVYASNDQDYPIAVVVGQAVHNTAAAARNEGVPLFPSVATREFKLLYRAIYKNVGGTATYQEATDLREVSTGPGSDYTAASHTDLTNRDALSSHPASAITPDTTNFDGALSTADDDVQKALETLNAVVADPSAATTAFVMGTGSSVAGQWYYLAAGVWVIGDAAAAACAVSMVGLAKGTNPEVDGMALRGIVTAGTWLAADRGAAVYLDDAGVFTLTCPTEALNPGEIRRIVGWVHSTAEIRMIEHAGGVLDGGS